MTARRSWAERALPTLARGLPARHREWVEALRAELAALDDPAQRTAFAASSARAVWRLGFGRALRIALTAGVLAAGAALIGSAAQLVAGGPGVLAVTVPVPALLLFLVGLDAARWGRSFGYGLAAGALALVACLVGVLVVTGRGGPPVIAGRLAAGGRDGGGVRADGDVACRPVGADRRCRAGGGRGRVRVAA